MPIQRKRKWLWLSPLKLHAFKVRAWSPASKSAWAGVALNLSDAPPFAWDPKSGLMARPIWFRRSIRVVWTAFPPRYRKWFSHYILFRKSGTPPTESDFKDAYKNGEGSSFFIAKTFKRQSWFGGDDNKKDIDFRKNYTQGTAWAHFYFDENIELETTYYYWVHAVNQRGELSIMHLGPDSALWGKPQVPVLMVNKFKTQIHEINKWSCDVLVWFDTRHDNTKPGGAEYYLIQRRQKQEKTDLLGNPLPPHPWGQTTRIDHDYIEQLDENADKNKGRYQAGVLNNFWVGKKYEFRIKAVNIPGIGKLGLESEWSSEVTYLTEHDNEPPPEVTGVSANRFYWKGVKNKGDYVRLRWDRFWQNDSSGVRAPILTEQLAHYNIYRFKGTDSQAKEEMEKINLHVGYSNNGGKNDDRVYTEGNNKGEYIVRKKVYKTTGKFEGTHFIDDDLDSTSSQAGPGTWNFSWNCEGANDTARRTAVISGGTVVGEIIGSASISTSNPRSGSYSFETQGGYIVFSLPESNTMNGDEGYAGIYVYTGFNVGEGNGEGGSYVFFEALYDGDNEIFIEIHYLNGLVVGRKGNGTNHAVYIPHGSLPPVGWNFIEVRWSVVGNYLSSRINSGSWVEADTSTPLVAFAGRIERIIFGKAASTPTYFDDISIVTIGAAEEISYHYWVSAVDIYGYESDVSMKDSYDKVSFLPPPNVTGLTTRQELVVNHPNLKMHSLKLLWNIIDEATHYQVRVKIKPVGTRRRERPYGKWHYSAMLREERCYDDDVPGKASYTYPLPLVRGTKVIFGVIAWNAAGKSLEWSESGEILVEKDESPPSNVKDLKGDCIGVNNIYSGIKQWNAVNISFQPCPHADGVKAYVVEIKNPSGEWEHLDTLAPKLGFDSDRFSWVRTRYTIYARTLPPWVQNRDYIRLRVYAIDQEDKVSTQTPPPNGDGPWPEITVNWERWWPF